MSFSSCQPGDTRRSNSGSYHRQDSRTSSERRKDTVDINSIYPPFCRKLDADLPDFVKEGDIEYPFEDADGTGDENKIRGNWCSKCDYMLSSVGYMFGLGNLWRFPYYCHVCGGIAFFVPYIVLLILAGIPLVSMEMTLGQFSSLACVSVWKVAPLFKGIGVTMLIISCTISVYYNMVAAWSLFYLINSFKVTLPWSSCNNRWNSKNCSNANLFRIESSCSLSNISTLLNESCISQAGTDAIQSGNFSEPYGIISSSSEAYRYLAPSEEFFHKEVLMTSSGIEHIRTINWQLVICLLLASTLIFLFLFKGVKSQGKAAYVTVIAPYLIIFVMFVRFLTLPGSISGLMYFFHPRWKALLDISVWGQAAVQVFYSLSVCTGGLGTLASYNRFHNNVLKDAVILSVIDTITCLLTASLVFSAVGFFCYEVSMELKGFDLKGGSYLLFVVLPETIAKLPVAPLYSLLYFIMVFFVILTTSVFLIETVVSGICDEFPERLRRNHRHVLTLICLCFYCLGVPLCTAAGIYWIHLLDHFITMLPLVTLSFFECMVICWVYGADNFLDNIKWMTGSYPPPYIAWKILWKFLSPVLYITLISFIFFGYQPVFYEDHRYPSWAYSVGWIISLLPALCVTVVALFEFCFTKGSCANRGRTLLCPESDWGPALAVHRAEYYPLQVPEARRLILPPASNFNTDKHGTSVDVLPNREEVAYCGSNNKLDKRQETRSGTTQSNSNHKRNHLPSFDRETAI